MATESTPSTAKRAANEQRSHSGLLGVVAAVAIVAVLTGLLYTRVALSGAPAPRPPLPVETTVYERVDHYERDVSYLGVVTAARKADLGFEVPGTIATAPPRPGTQITRGDVVATLENSALLAQRSAASAQLEQARAELELAELEAKRQGDLVATGAVSQQAHDRTRLQAKALLARVNTASAQLSTLEIELRKSRLLAPYDGRVADRYVHEGAVVSPGSPIVRLVETTAREAHVGLPAERAATLGPGGTYTLRVRDQVFDTQLLSVRPDVNPRTRAATAVFSVPPSVTALDGEAVTLQLTETVQTSGGWLPISALQEGKRGLWTVLRIDRSTGDAITAREAVEVIDVRGERAFVRGTLAAGSEVVASGLHRVGPGTAVAPTER